MSDDDQVKDVNANMTNAGTECVWMRRHFSDSVYAWACGQKADNEDNDPELSDALIGWLVLFGFAYTILMVLARPTSNSDSGSSSDKSAESIYLLPSVTGAMYLLIASTAHDLRSGVSLMVDGSRARHRTFGIGLLIVYGIMMSAAMTVLVSTSNDSASVILNGVAVLFIADMDEKALKFLSTFSKRWRLFWAIESIGISFALAIIAIFYMGDSSTLLEGNSIILKTFPTWFVWIPNPAAVTLFSVFLSSKLQAICEFCSAWYQIADGLTLGGMVASVFDEFRTAMANAKHRFREYPWFFVALGMWFAHGVAGLYFTFTTQDGYPNAVLFRRYTPTSPHTNLGFTNNILVFVFTNLVLVTGLVAKVAGVCLPTQEGVTTFLEPSLVSDAGVPGQTENNPEDVSSLLIGWGIGYWVTSLLYVLACSWHGGGCGWDNVPLIVTIISYVVIPTVQIAGVFMVADTSMLGTRFGAYVKPAVNILRDRRRVEYWIMASVVRDTIAVWIWFCNSLRSPLIRNL